MLKLLNRFLPRKMVGTTLLFFAAGNLIHYFHQLEAWIMIMFIIGGTILLVTSEKIGSQPSESLAKKG
jgi:Ni,Fe-hydrogenase I cytochrome b subunit